MRLHVLGSGTCVPRRRRGPAGYALEAADYAILVDSGSGTLGRLARAGVDYRSLTHALYTHGHPDHTADLAPLLFALNYTPGFARRQPLHLVGPPGFADFLDRLTRAWPWIEPRGDWLQLSEVETDTAVWPGLTIHSAPVDHAGIPANAYRLEAAGATVVFSGDTAYCQSLVELARDADLLVIEASAPSAEHDPGPHLTATEAGRIASQANVEQVVLTHLYPVCDEYDMAALCGEEFAGTITVAEDLMEIEIGGKEGDEIGGHNT